MTTEPLKLIWSPKPWQEDLIWCPSQLYKDFTITQDWRTWVRGYAYCRWRHADPWTVSFGSEEEDWLFMGNFCSTVKLPYFKDSEYPQLEKWVEANYPKFVAEIVEGAIQTRIEDAARDAERWEKTKVELGIKW